MNYIEVYNMIKQAASDYMNQLNQSEANDLRQAGGNPDVVAAINRGRISNARKAKAGRIADNASMEATRAGLKQDAIRRQQKLDAQLRTIDRMCSRGTGQPVKQKPRPEPKPVYGPKPGYVTPTPTYGNKTTTYKPVTAYKGTLNQDDLNAAAANLGIAPNKITKVRTDANGRITGINGIGF